MSSYEKIDDVNFKELNPAPLELVHNMDSLKKQLSSLNAQLLNVDDPKVLASRKANIQNQIDKIQARIAGGESVGVADAQPADAVVLP